MVACGLGDPDRSRAVEIAEALVCAREGKELTAGLANYINSEDIQNAKHVLFDDTHIFSALKSFIRYDISHRQCAPLNSWLQEKLLCVSSQQLNVESGLNHMTSIIENGGGKRQIGTKDWSPAKVERHQ